MPLIKDTYLVALESYNFRSTCLQLEISSSTNNHLLFLESKVRRTDSSSELNYTRLKFHFNLLASLAYKNGGGMYDIIITVYYDS